MRILLISHNFYPVVGGIETMSELLANAFLSAGHEVQVLTWTKEQGSRSFAFVVHRSPGMVTCFKVHAWADIVLENNISLRLGWPAMLLRKKSVVVLQTWLSEERDNFKLNVAVKKWWLRRASAVVAISDAVRKRHFEQAYVVGNAFDDAKFKIEAAEARSFDFVFVGRLVSDKGVSLAIEAMHLLKQQLPVDKSLTLTIIGDGPERHQLEALVAKLQLQTAVKFAGMLRGPELVALLNQHRFILVPSLWKEPFGIVALEGMACGCIPVVADGGGLPDAVGNAGLVFSRGDVNSLVACMKQLICNDALCSDLQAKQNAHLIHFDAHAIASRYLNLFENILSAPLSQIISG